MLFTHLLNVFSVRPDGSDLMVLVQTAPLITGDLRGPGVEFGASFDISGQSNRVVVPVAFESRSVAPDLSDGYEIVVLNSSDSAELWEEIGTRDSYFDFFPRWSPDESQIVFVRQDVEGFHLIVTGADGLNEVVVASSPLVYTPNSIRQIPVWSPGGRTIGFVGSDERGDPAVPYSDSAIFTVAPDGTNLRRLTASVSHPAWSPDGAQIAFAKPDGDAVSLFAMAADGSDVRRVAAIDGWHLSGTDWLGHDEPQPAQAWIKLVEWSPDGSMILYTCGTAVCVVTPDGKRVGRSPTRLRWPLAAQSERWVVLSRAEVSAAWSPDSTRIAVGLQREPTMNLRHDIMLFTMSPDGADVQVLVRGGRRAAGDRFGEPLRAAGPVPKIVPTNAYGCSTGHAIRDPANNPGLVEDCETLLELRDALAGAARLNWRGDRPMTEWAGVVVGGSPPRVEELNLARRGLMGTIPSELSELAKLRKLDLQVNRLSGRIPFELVLLQDIISLDLSFNRIDGEIPKWIGGLSKLESLDLAFNDFWGPIPVKLAELSELRRLHLRGNQLSGQIPTELEALGKLESLMLDGNRLTGCVPPGLPIDRVQIDVLGLPECEVG